MNATVGALDNRTGAAFLPPLLARPPELSGAKHVPVPFSGCERTYKVDAVGEARRDRQLHRARRSCGDHALAWIPVAWASDR